jgi:hypothetical protein
MCSRCDKSGKMFYRPRIKAIARVPGPTWVPITGLNSARNVSSGESAFSTSSNKAWVCSGTLE